MSATRKSSWTKRLSPRSIGAIYVLIALVVVFSIISPSNFANFGTAKLVFNQYAVTGLVGLALLLPLASGLYDLSVGSNAALSGIAAAWVLANVTANPLAGVAAGIIVSILAGLVNSAVVLGLGIDSFIGTLATGSIFLAIATAVSGDNTIATNVNGAFQQDVALKNILGLTLPVFVTVITAVLLYIGLEKSGFGRRTYSIGFDMEVARLSGVRVNAIRTAGLLTSATLSGIAGVLATAQIGAGSPATGPSFLLPAFAAAFLGATQFKAGRFNAWGTIVAVLLLGTGNVGLLVVGGPSWSPDVFDGVILIAAVGLTSAKGIGPLRIRALRRQSAVQRPAEPGSQTSATAAEAKPASAESIA